jgi:phosphoribosyl-ATP pyrophosphohydrolase / phosphoribosyl-AMP cyclohydrolase / histidinol dehydrogenase
MGKLQLHGKTAVAWENCSCMGKLQLHGKTAVACEKGRKALATLPRLCCASEPNVIDNNGQQFLKELLTYLFCAQHSTLLHPSRPPLSPCGSSFAMGTGFLVSIDPQKIIAEQAVGLTLDQVAYFGHCLLNVTPDNVESTLVFLRQNFAKFAIYLDVRKLRGWAEVVDLLNAGAAKLFVTFEQLKVLSQEPTISPDRLILTISFGNPKTDITKLKLLLESDPRWKTSQWAFDGDKGKDAIDDVLTQLENSPPSVDQTIYVRVTSEADGQELLHQYPGDTLIVPSERLTFTPAEEGHEKLIPAVDLVLAGATADRKTGLFATTVVDQRGTALGLVWSSKESISEALKSGTGVYQSRKRGLWYKGASSGDTQELISIGFDCDKDCLIFKVRQKGRGFCHLGTTSCWGAHSGLSRLEHTLKERRKEAPEGSYTARLFNDHKLVQAKIKEEADELCEATSKEDIASEAADLLFFVLTRCIAADVSLEDIEKNLDLKSLKVKRRKGDAKPQYVDEKPIATPEINVGSNGAGGQPDEGIKDDASIPTAASIPKSPGDTAVLSKSNRIQLKRYSTSQAFSDDVLMSALQRPSQKSNEKIMSLVNPIIADVRSNGDSAVLKYTHKFEKATSLKSAVLKAPFRPSLMILAPETIKAINTSYDNILKFHAAQKESTELVVETMPGVTCSRFSRPIERVGLYIPGGTAVLPSTALMLGVPAKAAGCKSIILATPPRADGTVTPEIVYIAHKVGAEAIVLAGGAQAVAAMAYGTESVTKVDKILGPGNQFVTAAKMIVSNDTTAAVSIDMPAGPSEVLVVADKSADPAFVAADLLSQAEHGTDSQVVLIAIDLNEDELQAIEDEVHKQANALPRVDIVRGAIEHSVTISVDTLAEAIKWSNYYAPEHLILQIENPRSILPQIQNAGSVFLGQWTPESVGDYSAGVNHSLPTYGYARQYSGVNLGSFMKHITSSEVTERGVKEVGSAVCELARVEGLDAHKRAMEIRMEKLGIAV